MKTWLLVWNVDRNAWDGPLYGYRELINDIAQVGHAYTKWATGVNKSIKPGDRIFLIKLGKMPKGIVASGYAVSGVYEGTHWDAEYRKAGKKARRIYIDFDKIKDYETEDILEYDALQEIGPDYHWSTQSSGVIVPESIAEKIEAVWKDY